MATTIGALAGVEEDLHHLAASKACFHDFGDSKYRFGLKALLEAFDTDIRLPPLGRQRIYDMVLGLLTARLYVNRGWAENPHIFAIPLCQPVFVIGVGRSGTTAMHRLLSLDAQFQGLEAWLINTPMVRLPREAWPEFPEYRSFIESVDNFRKNDSARALELQKAHDSSPGEVEESQGILLQTFSCAFWESFALPSYAAWLRTQRLSESYAYFANVLRLIGAQEPHKRWLLKSPVHTFEIDALLDVFPDARIIQMHRDPLKTIPSGCNLRYLNWGPCGGDLAQRELIGPMLCEWSRLALNRSKAASARSPMQFFHVDHRRFLRDPLDVVHAIYDFFDLVLSPNAESKMREWVTTRPMSRHGEHIYPVDGWGITPAEIRETFADYRAEHGFL